MMVILAAALFTKPRLENDLLSVIGRVNEAKVDCKPSILFTDFSVASFHCKFGGG